MTIIDETRFLERQQFFNGQRLFASDFQSLEELNREMRWLHNWSLHQPGVGSGYAMTGDQGAREVTVGPGYAIDNQGREIVLTETKTLQVPPVANDGYGAPAFYDLTVAYPEDDELEESEERVGTCQTRGVVRRREIPVFCWAQLGPEPERQALDLTLKRQMQSGARIRLARAEILNCQLNQKIALAQRRNARPATQPFIACGSTDAENWIVPTPMNEYNLTLAKKVDTSAAQFGVTPRYTAHVMGERQMTLDRQTVLFDGYTNIVEARANGFMTILRLSPCILEHSGSLAPFLEATPQRIADLLTHYKWHVEWIGIEG